MFSVSLLCACRDIKFQNNYNTSCQFPPHNYLLVFTCGGRRNNPLDCFAPQGGRQFFFHLIFRLCSIVSRETFFENHFSLIAKFSKTKRRPDFSDRLYFYTLAMIEAVRWVAAHRPPPWKALYESGLQKLTLMKIIL